MTDTPAPRDPVTREVIRSSLVAAADSMAVTVVRTARSAVVKDGMDFSTAVFNGAGEQVAQGLTLPFHMGAMQPALDGVLAQFGKDVGTSWPATTPTRAPATCPTSSCSSRCSPSGPSSPGCA